MPKTLQAAADELEIDIKRLRRWLENSNVEPARDPLDRRRKLLSDSQLATLKEQQAAASSAGRTRAGDLPTDWTSPTAASSSMVATLESRVQHLESYLESALSMLASLNQGQGDLGHRVTDLAEQVRQLRDDARTPAGSRG